MHEYLPLGKLIPPPRKKCQKSSSGPSTTNLPTAVAITIGPSATVLGPSIQEASSRVPHPMMGATVAILADNETGLRAFYLARVRKIP